MRDHVSTQRLDKLVEQVTEKASGRKSPDIPYVGLEHIAQGTPLILGTIPSDASTSVNSIFQSGDILFGKLRPNLRKSVQASFDDYCSTDILVFRTRPGICPGFAARVFQWEAVFREAVRNAEGTKMPRTSWPKLRAFEVFAPPLPEQRRIAAILDTVDAAIRQTEALIAKLKQVKAGLLHDLMMQRLDDCGRIRDGVGPPAHRKHVDLGSIPSEWAVVSLKSIATMITSGSRGWAAYYSEQGARFLRIGNLARDNLNLRLSNLVHVKPPTGGEGSRTAVRAGDLLISITADLGMIGVIPEGFGEAYVNQHTALVRLNQTLVLPRWLGAWLSSTAGQKQFYRLNDAGAKAGLKLPTVGSLQAPLPSLTDQSRIVKVLDTHDVRVQVEEAYRDKLNKLKQGLMDDLLTGRVRVPVAEEVMV